MVRNQHRWTYGHTYYLEWHFDDQGYAGEIPKPHGVPKAIVIGNSFLLKHNNAIPHTDRLVVKRSETETTQRMEWPVCSPYLNPTEHMWCTLRQSTTKKPMPPLTARD